MVVDGEVGKPGRYALEDFMKPYQLEERIYRLRCVEAWSMVIPWIGFPISALLKQVEPTSKAKYIRFETLQDPKSMPGQRSGFALIDWPYVEGLRLDEAMNPLAILAVGMYGRELPNQNGCAVASGGAVEVRVQEREVDCAYQPGGRAAQDHLAKHCLG